MKQKSVSGFVLGLISGLILLFISFIMLVAISAILALVAALAERTELMVAFNILNILSGVGAIIMIIGACLCFKKAKIGGILLIISPLLCIGLPCVLILFSTTYTLQTIILYLIWFAIIVMPLVGGILALVKNRKKIEKKIEQNIDLNETKDN